MRLLISIVFLIVSIVYWWRMFEKAGIAGWYSLIPFVNGWQIFNVIYNAGWKMLLMLVFLFIPIGGPFIVLIWLAILPYRICQAYGKDDAISVTISYIPLACSVAFSFIGLRDFVQIPIMFTMAYQYFTFEQYKGPVKDFV